MVFGGTAARPAAIVLYSVMSFYLGQPDYNSPESRARMAATLSRLKKGRPLSPKNRAGLEKYWAKIRGKPSPRRNGKELGCAVCNKSVYRNLAKLKESKTQVFFCSYVCAGRARDQGKTSENERIRDSNQYREWRRHVFQRDDYTCQSCGKRGGILHADHELPFAIFPALRFEILNGRTLCEPCHRATPTYGNKPNPFDLVEHY